MACGLMGVVCSSECRTIQVRELADLSPRLWRRLPGADVRCVCAVAGAAEHGAAGRPSSLSRAAGLAPPEAIAAQKASERLQPGWPWLAHFRRCLAGSFVLQTMPGWR